MHRVRRALGALLTGAGLVIALAAPALASTGSVPAGHGQAGAVWGAPCDRVGATANEGRLVCAQGKSDDCPRWHSVAPGHAGSGWVRPSTPPCTRCTPSAPPSTSPAASRSASPSASPSTSPAASRSSSTPAHSSPAGTPAVCVTASATAYGDGMLETPPAGACGTASRSGLPVTGDPVPGIVLSGLLVTALGVLLVASGRARRRAV